MSLAKHDKQELKIIRNAEKYHIELFLHYKYPDTDHVVLSRYASDAVRVGRLHTMCDGWAEASLKYMGSGGFTVSTKVPNIETETLVLWGRQDKILDPKLYAER